MFTSRISVGDIPSLLLDLKVSWEGQSKAKRAYEIYRVDWSYVEMEQSFEEWKGVMDVG